jgi:proline dehydrogenase
VFNRAVASVLPYIPRALVGHFSRPYIAGAHLEDAVAVVRGLMAEGCCATIDVLGEEVAEEAQTRAAVAMYQRTLEAIQREHLDANISIKPTHMGLKIDEELCFENLRGLAWDAANIGTSVRIDMEDSSCTDATLELYRRLHQENASVGTVLQARLRRTIDDVSALLPLVPSLRICKGIYQEPRALAYQDPQIVRESFAYAVHKLLAAGGYAAIATHDEWVVWAALRSIDELGIGPERYELQMLLGVEAELRHILVQQGHRLRVYVPYGPEWHAYSMRRLKENPEIVGHVMRNMLRRSVPRPALAGAEPQRALPNRR